MSDDTVRAKCGLPAQFMGAIRPHYNMEPWDIGNMNVRKAMRARGQRQRGDREYRRRRATKGKP